MNIPATVLGYEKDGRARVSLMEAIADIGRGQEVTAALRHDRPLPPSRKPQDFDFLHKKGLRVGGIVMLYRADVRDGAVYSPRIETLKRKADDIDIRVIPRTLCSILPPPRTGTAMVEESCLAFCNEALTAKTISSVLVDIELSLAEPCLYGPCGIVFRGPSGKNMLWHEVPPQERKPSEIVSDLLRSVPREHLTAARKAAAQGAQWETIPVVRLPIDPERQPRLSAQFANHDYSPAGGGMRFTLGTATLRLMGSTWVLFDATPVKSDPELFAYDSPASFSAFRLA